MKGREHERQLINELEAGHDPPKKRLGYRGSPFDVPVELRSVIVRKVARTDRRSGLRVRDILAALGVRRSADYSRREATQKSVPGHELGKRRANCYSLLAEGREEIIRYVKVKDEDYRRGNPERLLRIRQRKIEQARHHRKQENLKRRQRTLLCPFPQGEQPLSSAT